MVTILESSYFVRRSFTPQFLAKNSLRQSLSLLIRHMLRPTLSLEHELERSCYNSSPCPTRPDTYCRLEVVRPVLVSSILI